MRSERFFKNELLPFVEARHSQESTATYKPHLHKTLSIGAVEVGKVAFTIGSEKTVLAPGSLAVINPEVVHACNPSSQQQRSYLMLFLDVEWCLQVQQSMWEVDSFIEMENAKINDELLYTQYCDTMHNLMDDAIHLQEKEQLLFDLATGIFSITCSPQKIECEQSEDITRLKKLLANDLHRDLPINSLARDFAANPYTLIRTFKAVTGITPHAYRMNCRIEHAKKLLQQGLDIAETALECGFFDQSHFHRHFKAMTTVTPRQYLVNFIQ